MGSPSPLPNPTANQVSFLRTTRDFPSDDVKKLATEVYRSYVDVASSVNSRTMGIYPVTKPAVNGESWFINQNSKQQGFRQVYIFTSQGSFPHGLNMSGIERFVRIYGAFTDSSGTWYPLPYVDVLAANNQVNVIVTATNIVITEGAGALPTITKGTVVLSG